MPTINQIKYYIETAKCLSFSRASKNLFITQPTLGRQMTMLEEEYNMQFFIRSEKGLKLTPAGIVLYKEFEKLIAQYKECLEKAGQAFKGYCETIYIGIVSGMFINDMILEMMDFFKEKHPNIQLFLVRCTFQELYSKLSNDEIDVIISFDFNISNLNNIPKILLIPYSPAWFIPKSNPLSNKDYILFPDMATQDILLVQSLDQNDGSENIRNFCVKYGGFHPRFFYVKDMDNLLMWLEVSDKCAFLNSKITISEKVKMFPVEELKNEDSYLECAWLESNKKYGLSILLDYFSKISEEG